MTLEVFVTDSPEPGLGYRVFGTLENYPPGHSRYFLQKTLTVR